MLTEYFEEKRENIAVLEQTKSNVEKLIKQRNEELKGKPVITQKEGLAYCARQNEGKFEIRVPKNIHPVLINEDTGIHKMAVGAEDVPVVIDIGDAGIGKTKAAQKFVSDNPTNSILITVNPCLTGVKPLLECIADKIGAVPERSANKLWLSVVKKLSDGMVLIFDEAQQLTIDLLRN